MDEVKEILKLAGVRRWMDDNIHLLFLAGPVGISRWALELLRVVQRELKSATVKIKNMDASVIQAMVEIKKAREEALKADDVWEQAQKDLRLNMDNVSNIRKEDLRGAIGEVGMGEGLFGGQESFGGKRRSIYGEDRKRKKKSKSDKGKNPFERASGSRLETL